MTQTFRCMFRSEMFILWQVTDIWHEHLSKMVEIKIENDAKQTSIIGTTAGDEQPTDENDLGLFNPLARFTRYNNIFVKKKIYWWRTQISHRSANTGNRLRIGLLLWQQILRLSKTFHKFGHSFTSFKSCSHIPRYDRSTPSVLNRILW